ncbi:hypothetical protein [Chryseobacterium sp. MP_3.2]|uniref:hypothetical protein n=1 Tax=Chryseobacterium sp. MP_3.2 TaxID=3071712 RepID=UPI002E0199B6|nr:hypothetical protein [Chryseobacterium sp. MP_3.2]
MRKIFFTFFLLTLTLTVKAQYGTINAILTKLEERRGLNKNLSEVSLEKAKFVLIKEFEDHTERNFIIFNGKNATYVEVFDDKQTGQSTSNVFSGDVVRSNRNIISLRADRLEGKKIPIPLTKTFLLTQQKKILYLVDVNSKDRWIEEGAINKK